MPFVVAHVIDVEVIKGKDNLKKCTVDIGEDDSITVVTSCPNVRKDTHTVLATVGSTISDENGDEFELKRTTVGGVLSEGMLCDGKMLGWGSGSIGNCVQVPTSLKPGSDALKTKPGAPTSASTTSGAVETKSDKQLKAEAKEARKQELKAKKAARLAKKAEDAEKGEGGADENNDEDAPTEEDAKL